LKNQDPTTASAQSAEYLYISVGWTGTSPHYWLSGDFNLTPSQIGSAYFTGYNDVVLGLTLSAHNGLDRKYDYIWLRKPTAAEGGVPFCPNDASDHCVGLGAAHW
jgi:hypothetical protein